MGKPSVAGIGKQAGLFRWKRTFAVMLAGSFIALSSAVPSLADKPESYTFSDAGAFRFNCGPGVVLRETYTYTERGRNYFRSGELVRTIGHFFYNGIITNAKTGERFRDRNRASFMIDYVSGTFTYRGPIYQIHPLDGGRVLLLDAGTITGDLETGEVIGGSAKHPALSPNLFDIDAIDAAVCAALT